MLRRHATSRFAVATRLSTASHPRIRLGLVGLLMGALTAHAQNPGASDPRGHWITDSGNLEVEVAPCGQALCGQVSKVLGNRSMSRDGAEMDPVDKRPALGMILLRDFQPMLDHETGEATGQWSGEIYNRENGKTYPCLMSVSTGSKPSGELVLRAYMGLPLFGKTLSWTRSSSPSLAVPATGTTLSQTSPLRPE